MGFTFSTGESDCLEMSCSDDDEGGAGAGDQKGGSDGSHVEHGGSVMSEKKVKQPKGLDKIFKKLWEKHEKEMEKKLGTVRGGFRGGG